MLLARRILTRLTSRSQMLLWVAVTTVIAVAAFSLGSITTSNSTVLDEGAVPAEAAVAPQASQERATTTTPQSPDPAAAAVPTRPSPLAVDGSVVLGPAEGQLDGGTFLATFDGEPSEPTPFNPANWDITVHSRAKDTWRSLNPVQADHGLGCSPPPDTHVVTAYEDTAFQCKSHMMTSLRGDAYGVIYLTPPYLVDFTEDTAIISVDISTLRTSVRDWWSVWVSPYDDALQLPLDLDDSADLTGPPRNGIRVGLGTENQMMAEIYEDFENVRFPNWPHGSVSGDTWTGYETFLEPDRKRRDTFEIHLSQNHMKVGMPEYDFWWIDTPIPDLDWSSGVVQFGHHSYNPTKDCNIANNPIPPVSRCVPNTWHWDNLSIEPAVPFSMVRAEQRAAHAEAPTMTFAAPAPADARLRFAGIGIDMSVRFDDGSWQPAPVQATLRATKEEHFASYWLDVPEGTTQVEFRADNWYGGPWHVRDASFWALDS